MQRDQVEKNAKIVQLNEQLSQKESQIISLNKSNTAAQCQIKETQNKYDKLIETHNQIKSENSKLKEDISTKEKQFASVAEETSSKIKHLYSTIKVSANNFIKYQKEIEEIQSHINKNETAIDLSHLNQLIETENDESDEEISNIPIEQCVNEIASQISESHNKFSQLVSAYYSTVSKLQSHSNNIDETKQDLIKSFHSMLTVLSSDQSSSDLSALLEAKQKQINDINNSSTSSIISLYNSLSVEAIRKLLSYNNDKKEEISHLNERIEYFLKEIEIIKKSNEDLNRGNNSSFKVQTVKYESQLRLKNEEINKLNKRLEELIKTINTNKKQILSLTEELHDIKTKMDKQKENLEMQEKNSMLQKLKIANKDVSTGKFLIKEYFNKTMKFSVDLFNYCNEKE